MKLDQSFIDDAQQVLATEQERTGGSLMQVAMHLCENDVVHEFDALQTLVSKDLEPSDIKGLLKEIKRSPHHELQGLLQRHSDYLSQFIPTPKVHIEAVTDGSEASFLQGKDYLSISLPGMTHEQLGSLIKRLPEPRKGSSVEFAANSTQSGDLLSASFTSADEANKFLQAAITTLDLDRTETQQRFQRAKAQYLQQALSA